MKELFCDRDYTRVGFCQSILEQEGIKTLVRNQDLVGMMTEVPIPAFFPALCVLNDEAYDRALELLRAHLQPDENPSDADWHCPKCEEDVPATFDSCWACQTPKPEAGTVR